MLARKEIKQSQGKSLVPVVITTCNRPDKLKQLLKSLGRCYLARQTEVHIFVDAPFAVTVQEKNKKIIRLARSWRGFKKVHLTKRKKNLGSVDNLEKALQFMFKRHKAVIFLEDDNIVSKNFLDFMNQSLGAFQDDPQCFSICGYSYTCPPHRKLKTDIYTAPYFSAWGTGLFRHRYFPIREILGRKPDPFFLSPGRIWKCLNYMPHLFRLYMEAWLQKKICHDLLYSLISLKQKKYSVFPVNTKVINKGFDGSGIHCGFSHHQFYSEFADENRRKFRLDPEIEVNSLFLKRNREFFKKFFSASFRHEASLYWRYARRALGLRR